MNLFTFDFLNACIEYEENMSVSISVKRKTLEEIRAILKDIKEQEKNSSIGTIGLSKTIPCRVSKDSLNSALEKLNNLLE